MQAKAAVFKGPGVGFELVDLPVRSVEHGGILIKNTSASVCGSDLHGWRGDADLPFHRRPTITGHEFTGYAAAIGKEAERDSLGRKIKEGDRLAFPFFFPCNSCYHCLRNQLHACQNRSRPSNAGIAKHPYADGGYSEYFYLPQGTYKFLTPTELPDHAVTPVNCALAQVMFGLHLARPHFDDVVVVQGAGALGLYTIALAAEMGCSQVIAIDQHPHRLNMAKRCGATTTINIGDVPLAAERTALVRELTNGIGADIAVEVVGVAAATAEGLDMTRIGGTYLDIGNISGGTVSIAANLIITKQIKWIGVQHYNPWIIPASLDFLVRTKNKYPLLETVSHSFPLDKINQGFEFAEWQGKASGTVALRVSITL